MRQAFEGRNMIKQIFAWTIASPFLIGAFVVLAPILLLSYCCYWSLNAIKVPNEWMDGLG